MNKPVRKATRCFIINNKKVMVINYKEPHRRAGWYDIPGGKIEKDEIPIQTAIREVFEETTLIVDKLERKGNLIVEYPDRIFDFEVFVAKQFNGVPADLQENSSEWIEIDELLSKHNIFANIQLLSPKYIKYLKDDSSDFKMHIFIDTDENIESIEVDSYSFKPSISEKNGIQLVKDKFKNILSVGISTAGSAEIEMSKIAPNSHIIATTIDNDGLEFTKKIVKEKGLEKQIELKLEDISEKMPYSDETFDFVYARLVLHYLDNSKLEQALKEIKRVLKTNGLFYIVVRSRNEWEAKLEGATYDEKTGITKYPVYETLGTNNVKYLYRRLHTIDSLKEFLLKESFNIKYVKEYQEECYKDYKRTEKVEFPNTIIECLVEK